MNHDDAERLLAEAQAVLDRHATSSVDGRCRVCEMPGPCPHRETAVVVFSRFYRLPRRAPGASRPELVGARHVDPGGTQTGAGAP